MSKEHEGKKSCRGEIELWELEMVKKVASAFRTEEREELEAELAKRLLDLKRRRLTNIRNWTAYLSKFLYKSANWVRDRRARDKRRGTLAGLRTEGFDATLMIDVAILPPEPGADLKIAFAELWSELDPELRVLWSAFLEEQGNQVAVGRRIGKHRNTVRTWIGRIRRTLKQHGFQDRI